MNMDVQHCRYCGDYYRIDDDEMAIETDDGWVSDVCRPCQAEYNAEAQALDDAWQDPYQHLDAEDH